MEAGSTREAGGRDAAKEGAGRTLAQSFALVVGIVLIAAGVLGFFFGGSSFGAGSNIQGQPFLGFEVNGWHNIVHIATGAFLVFMAATARTAVTGLLVFGVVYVIVTIWGFIDGNDVLSIVPVNTADNVLHAILALVGLGIALAAGGLLGSARRGSTA